MVRNKCRWSLKTVMFLVTLGECGVSTTTNNVNPFLEEFEKEDNRARFSDPVANKEWIESMTGGTVHIFRPGQRYPKLQLHLCAYSENGPEPIGKKIAFFHRSGVIPFPMRHINLNEAYKDRIEGFLGNVTDAKELEFYKTFHYDLGDERQNALATKHTFLSPIQYGYWNDVTPLKDMVQELYTDSIIPTQDEISGILDANKSSIRKLRETTVFPIIDILRRGGPGVYYHVICRAPVYLPSEQGLNQYFGLLNEYLIPHPENNRLAGDNRFNVVKRIDASMRRMKALKQMALANPNQYSWAAERFIAAPNQFQRIRNQVSRTRSHSITQQAARKKRTRKLRKHRATRPNK